MTFDILKSIWYPVFNIHIDFDRRGIAMEHKDKKEQVKEESYEKPELKKEGSLRDITATPSPG